MPSSVNACLTLPDSSPFYENIETRRIILLVALATQAVSMWFLTAGIVKVSIFPPDSLYYLRQLPFTYWWGLAATLALLAAAGSLTQRFRVGVELSTLFLLALYVIGLPSFVYEGPRILDVYAHMSNTLIILNNSGWLSSPSWYTRQFPGAYTYLAQLIALAGIRPFDLMKYYPVASSFTIILFAYTMARSYNANHAATVSTLLLGGFWFQLHYSPQSLELIPYLGILFVFVRMIFDRPRQNLWTGLAIVSIPAFVVSHPETPLVVILGTTALLVLTRFLPIRGTTVRAILPRVGLFFLTLVGVAIAWWSTFASEARILVQTLAQGAISSALLARTAPPQTLPTGSAVSYQLVVSLEEGVAVTVWLLGLSALLLSRGRFRVRDYPLWAMFLAAVSTVPLTFYVRADMLQRSYLFSLIPVAILFAVMLVRKSDFTIRGRSIANVFKASLIVAMIVFVVLIPATRNGVDPYEYIPRSSLYASAVAADLTDQLHSVLFVSNGEYAWRFYSSLNGDRIGIRDEPADPGGLSGGFVKPNSTVTVAGGTFNLTLTRADKSSNYILLSDYYQNLYLLRFGPRGAPFYVSEKSSFEGQVSVGFDLVYTTGTDRIYANPDVGLVSGLWFLKVL